MLEKRARGKTDWKQKNLADAPVLPPELLTKRMIGRISGDPQFVGKTNAEILADVARKKRDRIVPLEKLRGEMTGSDITSGIAALLNLPSVGIQRVLRASERSKNLLLQDAYKNALAQEESAQRRAQLSALPAAVKSYSDKQLLANQMVQGAVQQAGSAGKGLRQFFVGKSPKDLGGETGEKLNKRVQSVLGTPGASVKALNTAATAYDQAAQRAEMNILLGKVRDSMKKKLGVVQQTGNAGKSPKDPGGETGEKLNKGVQSVLGAPGAAVKALNTAATTYGQAAPASPAAAQRTEADILRDKVGSNLKKKLGL